MFRAKDREKCQRLFEKYYGGCKFHDGLYRELIAKYLQPGQRILDAGCGRYMKYSKDLCSTAHVVGIDLEPTLETDNRSAPFGVRGDLTQLPFPSESFDMVISRSVVEHLQDPPAVFREFARVLCPGGKVVLVTPNKYDYVSVVAAFTPYRLHRFVVSRLFQAPTDDAFPTFYCANTPPALRKAYRSGPMSGFELRAVSDYSACLLFWPTLPGIGSLYERLTLFAAYASWRALFLSVFEKPGQSAGCEVQPLSNIHTTAVQR